MKALKGKLAVVLGAALVVGALVGPPASAQLYEGNGSVLVVGDSLQELSAPYLEKYLPGVPITINAEGGYNTFQIFDLFQEAYDPSQSVIVFDGGTNDNPQYPEILAGNLAKMAAIAPNRCYVVPTVHGYTVNGYNNDGKNKVVLQFAASHPGTQVPDWATFEAHHPELMQSDDLHPTSEGADARAKLIAQGIAACLSNAPTSSYGVPPGGGPYAGTDTVPVRKVAPKPAPPSPEEIAQERATAARLVGTEVIRHIRTIAERKQSPMALVLVAQMFSRQNAVPGGAGDAKPAT